MSLFLSEKISRNSLLGIWHITESVDDLSKMIPISTGTKNDFSVLNSFSNERRKKEWLVSRILVEQLTEEKDIRIIYDQDGKPFLENSKKFVSLSHSNNLLAVILAEEETGIDIELIKPKVLRIKEKFMNESELKSLQKENIEEQITAYWCAKEALYKLYGKKKLAFKEHLLIEPFQYSEKGVIKGWIKNASMNKSFTLQYEKLNSVNNNYMLAYVMNQV